MPARVLRSTTWTGRNELKLILSLTTFCSVAGSLVFYGVEPKRTWFESFWWALVTMTTVGYGDITPATQAGRLTAMVLMFCGVSIMALISASIASIMVENRLKKGKGLQQLKLRDHLIVAGWSPRIEVILDNLETSLRGTVRDVVLVNQQGEAEIEPLVEKYHNLVIHFVHGDPAQDFQLKRANADRAAEAIVLASTSGPEGSDEAADGRTIKIVMSVRSLSKDIKIFAEVRGAQNEPHLYRAGVDEVISSSEMGANVLANAPLSPGLPVLLRGLLAFHGNGFRTVDIPSALVGRTVADLHHHFLQQQAILLGLVTETGGHALEDLMRDSGGSFIDAFIQSQLSHAEEEIDRRSRFRVEANPANDYVIQEGQRAMVIMRQSESGATG